jgi:hypothetical protein
MLETDEAHFIGVRQVGVAILRMRVRCLGRSFGPPIALAAVGVPALGGALAQASHTVNV